MRLGHASDEHKTINQVADELIAYLTGMRDLKLSCLQSNRERSGLRGSLPEGWVYAGLEDFLLKHARFWTPRELPTHIPRMQAKMCFYNTYRLVARRKNLRYVEGIAQGIIPCHHAWAVDEDDNVIDPTWADALSGGIGTAYFGVAFSIDIVRKIHRNRDGCMSVLENWTNEFQIYKQLFTG